MKETGQELALEGLAAQLHRRRFPHSQDWHTLPEDMKLAWREKAQAIVTQEREYHAE